MTIAWPDILQPRVCSAELRGMSASGPRTYGGRNQTVYHDAGFWEFRLAEIVVQNGAQARAYRSMLDRLRTGEAIVLKIFDCYRLVGQAPLPLLAAAPLRATSLQLAGEAPGLEPGHLLSIGSRLYRVESIDGTAVENSGLVTAISGAMNWSDDDVWVDGSVASITILPPLRQAADEGEEVAFDALRCLSVLKQPDDGDLDLDLGRFGFPSATFVETI